jgi:hypothetical protein
MIWVSVAAFAQQMAAGCGSTGAPQPNRHVQPNQHTNRHAHPTDMHTQPTIANPPKRYMCDKLNKKNKSASVKPFMVKNHLWVFANTQIVNPAFDSQTKETLTTKASSFGSKCELTPALLEKISKWVGWVCAYI